MQIKVHKAYRDIISVCDTDILGKLFEEGNRILDVRENFFKGEEISEEKLIELMKEISSEADATFNIAGKKAVECALKAGIIYESGIKKIQGIPFALVLL